MQQKSKLRLGKHLAVSAGAAAMFAALMAPFPLQHSRNS